MLLRIGLALSAVAAVLAVVAVAVVATRSGSTETAGVPAETTAEEPLAVQRSYRERSEPSPERERVRQESAPAGDEATPLPAGNPGWPTPGEDEIASLSEPRRFAPDPNAGLTLTLPTLGVFDAPIFDSDSEQALEAGVSHVPETSMPWDEGAQRNVYLAAHRLGYPGTGSRLIFYELDKLQRGDMVIVEGRGEKYRYRVAEKLTVDPEDSWVMGQEVGRDMLTLQTCTPIPTFEKRLVVRADRVR